MAVSEELAMLCDIASVAREIANRVAAAEGETDDYLQGAADALEQAVESLKED